VLCTERASPPPLNHPSTESQALLPGGYSRAATTAGAAAFHRDQLKRTAYARMEPHGYGSVPFSVETYGRLGPPAMKPSHLLGDEGAGPGGVTRASFVNGAL
jgi:hypothetical protein